MRSSLPFLVLALTVSACRCGPDVAVPVTLRIKNPTQGPLFVDATDGRMGLTVQRNVVGEWVSFVEAPACECLSCDLVCGGCDCQQARPMTQIMKVPPGESFEREWGGVVQVSGEEACPGQVVGGTPCLRAENAPVDETFRLSFCYSPSAPGSEDIDGGVARPGSLPEGSILCVERSFKIEDGVVEIGPSRGADCQTHGDCTGAGELCFQGGCTTACPATGFPTVGATWQVRVPEPDDRGFFTVTQDAQRVRSFGTGTVTSVQYESNTMSVYVTRPSPNGAALTGTLYVTLPPGTAVPLEVGETVSVEVIDASSRTNPENRAVVIRDMSGGLLLAADTGQKGAILTPALTAPFTVTSGDQVVACQHTECGKNLFRKTRFVTAGGASELDPGSSVEWVSEGQTWKLVNVTNGSYGSTWCNLDAQSSWVIVNQRVEESP